jgi:transcriptional regulator with XRE-family HTH domain
MFGQVLTNRQIRAARALLGWSQLVLASRADVAPITVKRLEASDDGFDAHYRSVEKVKSALEAAGVVFLDATPDHHQGVALGRPR